MFEDSILVNPSLQPINFVGTSASVLPRRTPPTSCWCPRRGSTAHSHTMTSICLVREQWLNCPKLFTFAAYMRKVASSPNSSSNSTDPLWRINLSFRWIQISLRLKVPNFLFQNIFRIHILWASYVNVKDVDLIYVRYNFLLHSSFLSKMCVFVFIDLWEQTCYYSKHCSIQMSFRVGMYHGTEPLCQEKQSRQVPPHFYLITQSRRMKWFYPSTLEGRVGPLSNGYLTQVGPADPKWDEWLNMEINVLDIPRSATVKC